MPQDIMSNNNKRCGRIQWDTRPKNSTMSINKDKKIKQTQYKNTND